MPYADVEDPVALLNRAPEAHTGPQVADAIRNAGFEVQAVNWVWQKIVGESLVDSIVKPITGDFDKIAEQAGQWKNVAQALQAVRNNLNAGLTELQPAWQGDAADRFRNLIGHTWTLGIEADAQAANLIGLALNKVAQGSRRACDQILKLIKMLVDKLIEAAIVLPIPAVGWGKAVALVRDGIQIYNAIMQLIEGIKAIIQGAQQVIDGIQQVGTALSKIKDIHDLNDALNVANQAGQGAVTTASGAKQVRYGATQAAGATADLAHSAARAHDNATGLRAERAAANQATTPAGGTSGPSTPTRGSTDQGTTNRPANPDETRTPETQRQTQNDPIDVATGEMVLGQTDLRLGGVLPLVLRRTHVSSYRAGRSFGRSWASTVDQRLEFDEAGAVYVADDGMLLVYPDPPAAAPVLPQVGPRWPLIRTGTGYTITRPESGQTLHFTAQGALTAITDRNGNRIDVDRNAAGTVTAVRHSGGYHVEVDSTDGRITALRLRNPGAPDILVVRYAYDPAGRLTEVINSSNRALRFEYDADGRITQWTDRNGEWYRYFYDGRGRCIANQGSGGYLNGTFSYDKENRITRFTDALGHTTAYLLDARNNIVAETDPLGHTTTSTWDDHDRLVERTDPLGRTTRFEYDAAGNLSLVTRADGSRTRVEYNDLALPVRVVDANGGVWLRDYDERGNLLAETDPTGAITRYAYTERGHVAAVTDALGNTRRFETDPAGLPLVAVEPLGGTARYTRDAFGRVTSITDPLGATTSFRWTVEGRLTARTNPDGGTELWRHDGEGNLVEHVDAVGQVSRTVVTHFDLPAARIGADGARLEFGYDANLRLVSVTNPAGLVWHYEYDAAGRLVRETDVNGTTTGYEYDPAGQLVTRTNAAGETVSYEHDPVGNVVATRASTGEWSSYRFDPAGNLVAASNADAELIIERDPLGRVLAETIDGRRLSSEYDPLGRRIRRRTPTGAEAAWTYDANHQPVALHTAGQTIGFSYDPAGHEVERLLAGGAVLAQSWAAGDRLTAQTVSAATGPIQRRRYQYRPDGHLTAVEDALTGNRGFELDPAGRITAVHGSGWTERYGYDLAGTMIHAEWPRDESEAQGARVLAGTLTRGAGGVRYDYDPAGRVVLRQRKRLSRKPDTWHYTWNADDRLVGVVTPDGTRWRYRYDALGRRVAKERLGSDGTAVERVDFTWDGTTLAEQTHSGGRGTTWTWEPDGLRPVTQVERTGSQDWVDERFFAIVTDLVGTPSELVDPAGNLAWHAQNTVWGRALGRLTSTVDTPLRFPGQYHDPETGLHYNFHRYYDPDTGRYQSPDPIGLPGGPNPHAYVHNPTGWLDPLGLTPCPTPARFVVSPDGTVVDRVGNHNSVSLGRYPAYLQDAQASGSRTFNIGDAWNDMANRTDRFGGTGDGSEIWIRNSRFLDQAVARGSEIRLASDPTDPANAGSFFMREVQYLQSKGYTVSPDRTRMLPPGS